MATDKTTIKEWFKNGKKPDESQFAAWIDSYWHKEDEKIDLKAVNGLENALNNKTEKVDFNSLSTTVESHITNQNIHITEEEKNKLSNLTENLDGYIKKGETTLTVQLNLLKDENEDYYLNETSLLELEQFLKKHRSTINLQLRSYDNVKNEYWYLTSISEKKDEEKEYIYYQLTFLQIQSGEEKTINCESLVIDVKTLYEDDSIQDIQIARDTVSLAQDFDSNRYDTTTENDNRPPQEFRDPNMDYYTESGGISYYDPNKNIVQNLPWEATQGFGFVVGNDNNQAIQIIRDEVTGKIYHRGRISEIEWSEWAEMGEGDKDKYLPLGGGTITGSILPNTTNVQLGNSLKRFGKIWGTSINLDDGLSAKSVTIDGGIQMNNSDYCFSITHNKTSYNIAQIYAIDDNPSILLGGFSTSPYTLPIVIYTSLANNRTIPQDVSTDSYIVPNIGWINTRINDECIKKNRIQVVTEIPDLSTLEDGDIIIQL